MRWEAGPFTAPERKIVREVFLAEPTDGLIRNEKLKAALPNRRLAHTYKVAVALGIFRPASKVAQQRLDAKKIAAMKAGDTGEAVASIDDLRELANGSSGRTVVQAGPPSRKPVSDRIPAFMRDDFKRFGVIA